MSQYGRMLGKRYCHFYDRWRNLYPFLQILQHTDRTASSVRPWRTYPCTLTTIGALVIIFFLDEKIRLNLQDFAAVVIINLAVSLFVALFFVPSMIDKIGLEKKKRRKRRRFLLRPTFMKRLTVYFTRFYQGVIYYLCRFRVIACGYLDGTRLSQYDTDSQGEWWT